MRVNEAEDCGKKEPDMGLCNVLNGICAKSNCWKIETIRTGRDKQTHAVQVETNKHIRI